MWRKFYILLAISSETLKSDIIYSFGKNDCGQLGNKKLYDGSSTITIISDISDISNIACGNKHSLALRGTDKTIYSGVIILTDS